MAGERHRAVKKTGKSAKERGIKSTKQRKRIDREHKKLTRRIKRCKNKV